jgi:putative acetyltransferase
VHIRPEAPSDHVAVHEINAAAFGGEAEARLVALLREQARPVVSLVAEDDATLVGHIMFSPVSLHRFTGLIMGLAPMAVAPARQRQGIGSALVGAGLERCREIGAEAIVVLGHSEFYPRFGFLPAARFGLACEYDVPAETFMAMALVPGALRGATGTVSYHPAFAGIGLT